MEIIGTHIIVAREVDGMSVLCPGGKLILEGKVVGMTRRRAKRTEASPFSPFLPSSPNFGNLSLWMQETILQVSFTSLHF